MDKSKRILALFLSMIMCIGVMCMGVYADTSVIIKNTVWTMSDHAVESNIGSDFEWKNLSVAATTEKYVSFDGTYLKLGGAGSLESPKYRVVMIKVAAPCEISVTSKSTSTDTRTLQIEGSYTGKIGTISAPSSATSGSVNYNGYGENIYIYSTGKGIDIKSITVTYNSSNNLKGDVNGDGAVNAEDAAYVLKYLIDSNKLPNTAQLAAANANNDGVINILDSNWILNNVYEPTSETTTIETIDTKDGTEVTDYDSLVNALSVANAKVYVMNDIEMGDRVQLSEGGQSIIGVPNENGELPVLNFENMTGSGKDITTTSSGDGDVGLKVKSANNIIKNLVVEKAKDNGIQIKGVEAIGNTVENCIVRYNNDSGIQVTGGACATTLIGVYSYRNCDVYTRGGNADGFAIKLGAGPTDTSDLENNKTTCINCYAWENADDGWDSFDKTGQTNWTYRNDYENCMCWNNGDPANCLGYYDYINSYTLDENLPFIRRFKALYTEKYDAFVTAYNNGTLCSRFASTSEYYNALSNYFATIKVQSLKEGTDGNYYTIEVTVSDLVTSTYWAGNPNGFKLGSAYTQSNSERYMTNCIAFDHGANGFDRNNSKAQIYAQNCMSFDNKINYHLDGYTAYKWTNVYGWSGTSSNTKPTAASGVTVSINDGSTNEDTIRAAAGRLIGYANDNKVVYSSVFDEVFKS